MSADIQQNILVQLQGDAQAPADAASPDLVPIGVVDPPETKKRAKKASRADDDDGVGEETKKKAALKRKRTPNDDNDENDDEDGGEAEEEEETRKPKPKRKRPVPGQAADETAPKKKAQPKKKPSAPRKQPGYTMIKTEDDRLRGALEALLRKRKQREDTNGGKAPTSTCGVLTNNLVDFYENVVESFARKFGRYIN
jgi:hypothetical protein